MPKGRVACALAANWPLVSNHADERAAEIAIDRIADIHDDDLMDEVLDCVPVGNVAMYGISKIGQGSGR